MMGGGSRSGGGSGNARWSWLLVAVINTQSPLGSARSWRGPSQLSHLSALIKRPDCWFGQKCLTKQSNYNFLNAANTEYVKGEKIKCSGGTVRDDEHIAYMQRSAFWDTFPFSVRMQTCVCMYVFMCECTYSMCIGTLSAECRVLT